jgi:hypothetical protein
MPPVREQGHRAENCAAHDLGNHHRGGETDDKPGPAFVAFMSRAEKEVLVSPFV